MDIHTLEAETMLAMALEDGEHYIAEQDKAAAIEAAGAILRDAWNQAMELLQDRIQLKD